MIYGLLFVVIYTLILILLKMASALYVCCLYSNSLQTAFNHATIHNEPRFLCLLHIFKCTSDYFKTMEPNSMNPDQTATKGAV